MPRIRASTFSDPFLTPPLKGYTIAVTGNLRRWNHNIPTMHALIAILGGKTSSKVTASVTHLISTRIDFTNDVVAVKAARAQDIPIVKPDWVLECRMQHRKVPLDGFLLTLGPRRKRRLDDAAEDDGVGSDRVKRVKRAADGGEQVAKFGNDKTDATDAAAVDKTKQDATAVDNPKQDAAAVDKPKQDAAASTGKEKARSAKKGKLAPIVPIITGQISPDALKANKTEPKSPPKDSKPAPKAKKEKPPPEKPLEARIDPKCPLSSWCVYIDHSAKIIYDVSLIMPGDPKTDHKYDSHYRMQLLHNSPSDEYRTWTRWGVRGEMEQTCIHGDGTFADAELTFQQRFVERTGVSWEDRKDAYKPGKYIHYKDTHANSSTTKGLFKRPGKTTKVACSLSKPVQSVLALIFDRASHYSISYHNSVQVFPIKGGDEGHEILQDLDDLFCNPSLAKSCWLSTLSEAKELLSAKLRSPAYLHQKPWVSLVSNRIDLLTRFRMLDQLTKDQIANIAPRDSLTVHPFDLDFSSLGMDEFVPLDQISREYQTLYDLLAKTRSPGHKFSHTVENIFRIKRRGEAVRFAESRFATLKKSNRRLLWHGSAYPNFAYILSQGLRNPPNTITQDLPLGRGVFLADISSKSLNFIQ
ncbi:hypothetical protein CDD82_7000 [Ophiocordyceps australis]|uniref:Poly [ADP-ribose] polymerase n=1 Tax=Ophiocordyceps australis TaxID=1399860 RepID=A0A2C5YSZ7_9HYPO|nr:hypothetical protein CDD82_7000 [Ophiocordyceps australis]